MKLFTLLPSTLSSPQGHPVLGCDNDVVRRGFFAVLSAASLITDVWVSLFGLDERAQIKLAILSLKAEVSSERRTGASCQNAGVHVKCSAIFVSFVISEYWGGRFDCGLSDMDGRVRRGAIENWEDNSLWYGI